MFLTAARTNFYDFKDLLFMSMGYNSQACSWVPQSPISSITRISMNCSPCWRVTTIKRVPDCLRADFQDFQEFKDVEELLLILKGYNNQACSWLPQRQISRISISLNCFAFWMVTTTKHVPDCRKGRFRRFQSFRCISNNVFILKGYNNQVCSWLPSGWSLIAKISKNRQP